MKRLLCLLLLVLLTAGCAARAERLTDEQLVSYYDDALFVGDSLPRMLRNYIVPLQKKDPGFFRGVRFYTAYNYQLSTAAKDRVFSQRVNLVYKGRERTLYELVTLLNPPKLFILAGLNDRSAFHPEKSMEYVRTIVTRMKETAPDTEVYFFSLPPVTAKVEKKNHLQAKWDSYNELLKATCEETGAVYIDIATDLKGEDGLMIPGISSDGEFHLNDRGNAIWVQTLLDFAQSRYDAGLWQPAERKEREETP